MARRVAIVQSNYIPWKGYFDLIAAVDEFILFDEVQYTRRDWRNRNRIKTQHGTQWLTIPVAVKDRYLSPIRDMVISDPEWNTGHWKTLSTAYARARCFPDIAPRIEEQYLACTQKNLSDVNRYLLAAICQLLGIETPLRWSWEYPISASGGDSEPAKGRDWQRSERLAEICAQAGAAVYLSGPSASAYLQSEPFAKRGIAVEYFDYSGYRPYEQTYPPFDHYVSVVDLLFNTGTDARRYLLWKRT
jgi:hypothetical protein